MSACANSCFDGAAVTRHRFIATGAAGLATFPALKFIFPFETAALDADHFTGLIFEP